MSLSMSALTLQIPDELAERLRGHEHELSEILELGLRELASGQGFAGAAVDPPPAPVPGQLATEPAATVSLGEPGRAALHADGDGR